jgi:acyl dehydratase
VNTAGDARPGDGLPAAEYPIERADLVRYAGASGDFNRIHWDDEFARSVGLPGVIAHGMYSMGLAARSVSAFAGDPRTLRRLRVRFSAMIRPGQTLTVSGTVASVDDDGAVTLRFEARNDDGERVLAKGEAELAPSRNHSAAADV